MNRVYAILGLAFIILSPLWYGWVIYNDLTHPEAWDQDLLHDPRFYLPVLAVGAVIVGVTMRWVYRTNCKTAQRMAELGRIKAMQTMGRGEESGRLMSGYIIKWNLAGDQKPKQ